jgi:hypothetical protein
MLTSDISANIFGYVVGALALLQIVFRPRFHLPAARAAALRHAVQQARHAYEVVRRRNLAPDMIWWYRECLEGSVVSSRAIPIGACPH